MIVDYASSQTGRTHHLVPSLPFAILWRKLQRNESTLSPKLFYLRTIARIEDRSKPRIAAYLGGGDSQLAAKDGSRTPSVRNFDHCGND